MSVIAEIAGWALLMAGSVGIGWLVHDIIGAILKWRRNRHGHRNADQAGNGGAAGGADDNALAEAHRALERAVALARSGAGARAGLIAPTVQLASNGWITENCGVCGECCVLGAAHACPTPDDHDLAVVSAIQRRIAASEDWREVADDFGLAVGWRVWRVDTFGRALTGCGIGAPAPWPIDRPAIAVCAEPGCAVVRALRSNDSCQLDDACRLYAHRAEARCIDLRRGPGVLGAVALWGEVDKGPNGYKATRGYPLALDSIAMARAYRVALWEAP